jgi:hypothetical protein
MIMGDNYGEIDLETGEYRFFWQCKRCGRNLTDRETLRGQLCSECN